MMMDDVATTAVGLHTGSHVLKEHAVIDAEVGIFRTRKGAVIKQLCGFSVERRPSFHFISLYGTAGSIETDRYRPYANLKGYFKDIPNTSDLIDIPVPIQHPRAPAEATQGGHGTSEYFMAADFLNSIKQGIQPQLNVRKALAFSAPGICAHESAQRGGTPVDVPDFCRPD